MRIARVAQLVEQRIENPCVRGSIPRVGTTSQNELKSHLRVAFFISTESHMKKLTALVIFLLPAVAHAYLLPGPIAFLAEILAFGLSFLVGLFFHFRGRKKKDDRNPPKDP